MARGQPGGTDRDDWLEAERQLAASACRGWRHESSAPRGEPPSEGSLPAKRGDSSGPSRVDDGDEPNCPLRVEDRVDAFNNLEDL